MAYEPLHLKYRPQCFADVVGQSAVVKTLANAIRLGRIAPAYLFCGPRGTGKTSSARILAKSLNCIHGPTPNPCNQCEQCLAITSGTSLDVIEVDAASNTGVDNIRDLIERAQFAPVNSLYKVYVLDEVHMLSTAAFNALLKTLEEPPAHVVFVLATTDPQRVLPTIISRCQRFDFRRIPLESMIHHLKHIASNETIPIDLEAIELIAQLSQGGLRDAESLLDQISLLEGPISVETIWDLVGAVPERQLLALIDAVYNQDPEQLLTQIRHLLDHGKEPLSLLQNLVGFYRDLLLAKTAPQRRDLVALTQPTWEALQQRSEHYNINNILAAQTHLRQAEPQIRQTNQPRLWLEITLMDLLPLLSVQSQTAPQPIPMTPSVAPALVSPPSRSTSKDPAPILSTSVTHSKPTEPIHPKPTESKPTEPIHPKPTELADQSMAQLPTSTNKLPTRPTVVSTPSPQSRDPASPTLRTLSSVWDQFLQNLAPVPKGRIRMGEILEETLDEIVIGFPTEGFAKMAKEKQAAFEPVLESLLERPVKLKFKIKTPKTTPESAPPTSPVVPIKASPSHSSGPTLSVEAQPIAEPSPPVPPPLSTAPDTQVNVGGSYDDELEQAARQVAHFFNGLVISLDQDEIPVLDQIDAPEPTEESDHQPPTPSIDLDDDPPF